MVRMCVKRDAKEAESRAGRGERCRPRIRLRGGSLWMAVDGRGWAYCARSVVGYVTPPQRPCPQFIRPCTDPQALNLARAPPAQPFCTMRAAVLALCAALLLVG